MGTAPACRAPSPGSLLFKPQSGPSGSLRFLTPLDLEGHKRVRPNILNVPVSAPLPQGFSSSGETPRNEALPIRMIASGFKTSK